MERTLVRFEKSHGRTEVEIRKRILQAIFEQRLPPGEKITEEQLATTFDVSRTVVRQAMARLSQDGILVKSPNIGSTIAAPTRKEARDILAVRRMVEPDIVGILSPHWAVKFFLYDPRLAFLAMASVFLAVTGAETLYADMGHFGRKAIGVSWLTLV